MSKGAVSGALVGVLLAAAIAGCRLRTGRRTTGTCSGACDHYLACKRSDDQAARTRCQRECPEVFSDEESLREFEKLSCRDPVEFVEGTKPRATATER